MLKKVPFLVKLQKADVPAYEILSLALGIAGAFALGIPNAVVIGIVTGLAAGKGYDFVANNKDALPKVDLTTMAKTIVPILMIMFLCVGCSSPAKITPAAWLLSGANTNAMDAENEVEDTLEYIGRVGVQVDNTEFGLASNWWMERQRQSYGVYAVQFLSQDPNSLLNKAYIGGQATLDVEEDGGMYGFVTGKILDIGGLEIVTEFTARTYNGVLEAQMPESEDRYKAYIGLRIPFPISK
jgi:hypothetical protein